MSNNRIMVFTTRYDYSDKLSIFKDSPPVRSEEIAIVKSKIRLSLALKETPKQNWSPMELLSNLFRLDQRSATLRDRLKEISGILLDCCSRIDKNAGLSNEARQRVDVLSSHKDKVASGVLATDILQVLRFVELDDECMSIFSHYIIPDNRCSVSRIDSQVTDSYYSAIAVPYLEGGGSYFKDYWAKSLFSIFRGYSEKAEMVLAIHGSTDWNSDHTGYLAEESEKYSNDSTKVFFYLFRHEQDQDQKIARALYDTGSDLETIWKIITTQK